MSETIKVSKEVKKSLIRVAAKLQDETGRRIDLDEAIRHLISPSYKKRPELLDQIFGSVPKLGIKDVYKERRLDELRTKRKYGV